MKTKLYIFLAIIFITSFTSCEDLLDVKPKSSITVASMWENEDDAWGALYGTFNQWRSAYGGNYYFWGEFRTGYYESGVSSGRFHYGNLWDNTLIPDDNGCDWGSIYTLINDCNLILKYVPEIEFSNQQDKDFIIGNAYFLRSFAYFYIARIWGEAPVLLDPHESANQEGMYPERNPVEEVFTQAELDIEEAINLIPTGYLKGTGIASKEVANMLKADIYLWRSRVNGKDDLEKAMTAVDYVLSSSNYQLMDSYKIVFEDDNNKELMLSIIHDIDETTRNNEFLWPTGSVPASIRDNPVTVQTGTMWSNISEAYRDFLQEDPNDTRAFINAAEYTYIDDQEVETYFHWFEKYKGNVISGTRVFDSDYRVYRLAEAILFKAEILNEMGQTAQAIEQLNKIAKRAYNTDNYYPTTLNQAEVDDAILDERIKEFVGEGKAWFDLIRFDKAFERIPTLEGKENKQNILLWPVSYNTINRNGNIKQTPGYD